MKKNLVFGSIFILSAYLILFVGCNSTDNVKKSEIKNEIQAPKKEDLKKDVNDNPSDVKKQLEDKSDKALKSGQSETSQSVTDKNHLSQDLNTSGSTDAIDKKIDATKKEILNKEEELKKQMPNQPAESTDSQTKTSTSNNSDTNGVKKDEMSTDDNADEEIMDGSTEDTENSDGSSGTDQTEESGTENSEQNNY